MINTLFIRNYSRKIYYDNNFISNYQQAKNHNIKKYDLKDKSLWGYNPRRMPFYLHLEYLVFLRVSYFRHIKYNPAII